MSNSPAKFAEALACVEELPFEDQEALIVVVNKRIAAARRRDLLREINEARGDYHAGKVKRGSSAVLMRELRRK